MSRRNKNFCELAFDSWTATSVCEVELSKLHFNMTLKGRDTASEWSRKATLNSLFQDLLWRMIGCICFIFPPCSAAAWIGAKSGFDAGAV